MPFFLPCALRFHPGPRYVHFNRGLDRFLSLIPVSAFLQALAPQAASCSPGSGARSSSGFHSAWLWTVAVLLLLGSHLAWSAVDLNTADEMALRTVRGIGPVKAHALIAWRTRNGAFHSPADVRKVKGFGAKTLARIGANLTISGRPLLANQPGTRQR